jgi:thioredoxin 1
VNLLIYAVLGLIVTWALYVLYIQVATRAVEGRPADPLYDLFPALKAMQGRALVYCCSPQCGPCRPMSREVDGLAERGAPIFKLDITEHPALARELGIRATPALILIERGSIARVLLGVKSARYMSQLIAMTAR